LSIVDLSDGNRLVTMIFSKAFRVDFKNGLKNSAGLLIEMCGL